MNDFLNNPEERIAAFGNSKQEVLKNEEGKKVVLQKEKKKDAKKSKEVYPSYDRVIKNKVAFSVKVDKNLEIPIRTIILEAYKKTGLKITIQDVVNTAIEKYIDSFD